MTELSVIDIFPNLFPLPKNISALEPHALALSLLLSCLVLVPFVDFRH
jgi:hypothetical protein